MLAQVLMKLFQSVASTEYHVFGVALTFWIKNKSDDGLGLKLKFWIHLFSVGRSIDEGEERCID